jgi:methyl-accepting chemotaxis protein
MKHSIKSRIVRLVLLCTALPIVLLLVASLLVQQIQRKQVVEETDGLLKSDLAHIAYGVQQQVATAHALVEMQVEGNMRVALEQVRRMGGVNQVAGTLTWQATNQHSQESASVSLPAIQLGSWNVTPIDDATTAVPLVDTVRDLVGGTVTVFQRMNETGDMLRVATTVLNKEGRRAIGTYIPAVNPDGAANTVVKTVLKGETYRGKAFVVDSWYTTSYVPLMEGGEVAGMLHVGVKQESIESLRKSIMDIVVGKTGYVWVIGGEGQHHGHYIISQQGKRDGENILEAKDAEGKPVIRTIVDEAKAVPGQIIQVRYLWHDTMSKRTAPKVAAVVYYQPWDWVIGASAWEDDFMDPVHRLAKGARLTLIITLLVALGALVLSGWFALASAGRMAQPIVRLSAILREAMEGNLNQEEALADRSLERISEVGELASSFSGMIGSIRRSMGELEDHRAYLNRNVEHLLQAVTRFAQGDLTVSVQVEREDELGRLIAGFNSALATIRRLMADLAGSSGELQTTSGQLDRIAGELKLVSARTRDKAEGATHHLKDMDGTMQAMAAATEEISATIQEIANSSHQATVVAGEAVQSADQASLAIQTLDDSSQKISAVIQVIDTIAKQTNLLALNATIEAARAGEAGKGFAVVAGEVKELASGTTRATEDIRRMIDAIQQDTTRTVDGIGHILEVVTRIRDLQGNIAGAIEEQATTTREFAGQISQVAGSTSEVATSLDEVLGGTDMARREAEQTAAAASRLADLSSALQQHVAKFRY